MKLTKIESLVFEWFIFLKTPQLEIKKWLNKIKLERIQDQRSFWDKIQPLDRPLREMKQ